MISYKQFRKIPCPKCGRKGLHYLQDHHTAGWEMKDYSQAECRFCYSCFPIEEIEKLVEKEKK